MSWPQSYQPTTQGPPVTSRAQRSLLCSVIDNQFSQKRGGQTMPMESMWHVWQFIIAAKDEPTVLVCCTGEKQRSIGSLVESDRMHRVDRQWTAVIIRGHGFRSLLTEAYGAPPGAEDLSDSIEALRDTVRGIGGVSEEFPLHYIGWETIPAVARPGTANVFTAGAFLTFSSANDVPEVVVVSK